MRTWTIRMTLALAVALTATAGCGKKQVATPPGGTPDGTTGGQTDGTDPGSGDPNGGTDPGTTLRNLEDVFFDYDQYALRDDSRRVLDANADVLKTNSDWSVTLEGHCDERGTVEYNLALAEKRARAAKDYLVRMGVEDSRLRTISYGEERPFDPGHDESAWSQNRRVHMKR